MVYHKIRTLFREQALSVNTGSRLKLFITGRTHKVCRRTAYVVYITLEILFLSHYFSFFYERIITSCRNYSSLMKGYGAETAAAKASSVCRKTEFYFFYGRYSTVFFIHGVICPHKRKSIYIIKLVL